MINNNQQPSKPTSSKPNIDNDYLMVTSCTKGTLNAIKTFSNGKLYHTTDTNEFFFDWNNKRYQLNWFGSTNLDILQNYLKKRDNITELNNNAGYIDIKVLQNWLKNNGYDTSDNIISNIVKDIEKQIPNLNAIDHLHRDLDGARAEILELKEIEKRHNESHLDKEDAENLYVRKADFTGIKDAMVLSDKYKTVQALDDDIKKGRAKDGFYIVGELLITVKKGNKYVSSSSNFTLMWTEDTDE